MDLTKLIERRWLGSQVPGGRSGELLVGSE